MLKKRALFLPYADCPCIKAHHGPGIRMEVVMLSASGLHPLGQRVDLRPAAPPSKPLSKTKIWPRPNFRALSAGGMSTVNLMVLRTLHAALPSKPRAAFHGAAWRHAEAVEAFRDAALWWIESADHSPTLRFNRALLESALSAVMTKAFGAPAHNDPCYFTRRHVVDRLGCQIYALLGDNAPHRFVPLQPKIEKLNLEISRGWPVPRPSWERRHMYVVASTTLSVESRGMSTFARWANSSASDRGVFQTFADHADALDWLQSLSPYLLFTDKGATRLLSAHDNESQAIAAASSSPARAA